MSQINNNQHVINDSPLGKQSAYVSNYSPELLYFIPRAPGRIKIMSPHQSILPPFFGLDIWNAYELSWLDPRGVPRVAIGQIIYSCRSTFIVESKSLKLYLNSLNGSNFSSSSEVCSTISRDLSAGIGVPVSVKIYEPSQWYNSHYGGVSDAPVNRKEQDADVNCQAIIDLDQLLLQYCEERDCEIGSLSAIYLQDLDNPELQNTKIDYDKGMINNLSNKEITCDAADKTLYFSRMLRSLCPVTGQPDWGNLYIESDGTFCAEKGIKIALYLVQKRDLMMFHEQCVEKIFMDILCSWKPNSLRVWANYTRRGGIDINPYRILLPVYGVNMASFEEKNIVEDEVESIIKFLPDAQRDIRQ